MSPDGTLLRTILSQPAASTDTSFWASRGQEQGPGEEQEGKLQAAAATSIGRKWLAKAAEKHGRGGQVVGFPTQILASRLLGVSVMCADPKAHCVHTLTAGGRRDTDGRGTWKTSPEGEREWSRDVIAGEQPQVSMPAARPSTPFRRSLLLLCTCSSAPILSLASPTRYTAADPARD